MDLRSKVNAFRSVSRYVTRRPLPSIAPVAFFLSDGGLGQRRVRRLPPTRRGAITLGDPTARFGLSCASGTAGRLVLRVCQRIAMGVAGDHRSVSGAVLCDSASSKTDGERRPQWLSVPRRTPGSTRHPRPPGRPRWPGSARNPRRARPTGDPRPTRTTRRKRCLHC